MDTATCGTRQLPAAGAYSGFEVRGGVKCGVGGRVPKAPTGVGSPSKWCILMHSGARLGQL